MCGPQYSFSSIVLQLPVLPDDQAIISIVKRSANFAPRWCQFDDRQLISLKSTIVAALGPGEENAIFVISKFIGLPIKKIEKVSSWPVNLFSAANTMILCIFYIIFRASIAQNRQEY